jgi:hypothetical protein
MSAFLQPPLAKRRWESQVCQSIFRRSFNEGRPTDNASKSPESLKQLIYASRSDPHSID